MSGPNLTWIALLLVVPLLGPGAVAEGHEEVQERAYRQLPSECSIPVLPVPGLDCRLECDPMRCLFLHDTATQAHIELEDATEMLVLFKVSYYDGAKERDVVCRGACTVPVSANSGHLFVSISPTTFTPEDYAAYGTDLLSAPHATAGTMTVTFR